MWVSDVHRTQISKYERGETEPQAEVLARLSRSLGVSVDEFLLGVGWQQELPRTGDRAFSAETGCLDSAGGARLVVPLGPGGAPPRVAATMPAQACASTLGRVQERRFVRRPTDSRRFAVIEVAQNSAARKSQDLEIPVGLSGEA
jgi:hypothetical protein